MDKKLTDAHVVKIAKFLPKWKAVSKLLGLEGQIIRDIEDRCRSGEDQRSEALMKWVGKEDPRATYRTLYDVLLLMEEGEAAEKVEELTRDTKLQLKDVFEPIKTLAAEEWRDIGEALHIEGVESIPSTPGITRTDEAYLREVLRTWLNTIDPSIQDLITALRECYREEAAKVLESCFAIRTVTSQASYGCQSANITHPNVCTLVVSEVAGQDHCLVSSDGGSTNLKAYKMMTSPHGIALIISNIEFDKPFFGQGLSNRTGGDVDEMNLQDLFGPDCLNYKVVLLKNLTGEQIETAFCLVSGHKGSTYAALHKHDREALKALSDGGNLISKDHDSFVCCLLSHGNKGKVCGTDGKKFDLSNIYYYLGPCKHLAGKPKMVFIQACQGDKIAEHDGAQQPSAVEDDGGITTRSHDFILSCAAFHGQKSFRSCTEGTWYISALCRIFKENHKKMDVVSMITDVHNEVSNEKGITERGEKCRQCPRLDLTLRYKVQLAVMAPPGS